MATAKKAAPRKVAAKKLVAKNYRLLKYQPLTYTLKVGRDNRLLIFDEKEGRMRAIRHCPNEASIFVEEQSEMSVVQPIIFLKGLLETKEQDVTTQEFLDNHPGRGGIFELIDLAADATDLVDLEEAKIDVKAAIRAKAKEETGADELRLILGVLTSDAKGVSKMELPEIKTGLYELVNQSISRFVDEDGEITIFDDVSIQREAIAIQAFNSGKIQVSADGSKIMWSDSKSTICLIPVGQNHTEYFAKFLGTDEGIQVAVEIARK